MSSKPAPRTRSLPDSYYALIESFPLTHLRDHAHLREAAGVVGRLLGQTLDEGAEEYLAALTDLIQTYESEYVPIADSPEADVLRVLIASSGFSQPALAKKVGIAQSTISAVLNGDRSLTKAQIIALARFFRDSPAAFLPSVRHVP